MPLPAAFTPNASVTKKVWTAILAAEGGLLLLTWVAGDRFLLPGPAAVASAWVRMVQQEGLLYELLVSLWTNLRALAISTAISLFFAWGTVLPAFRPVVSLLSKARFFSMAGFTVVFIMAFGGGDGLKVALLTFGMTVFFLTSMASVVSDIPRSEFDHARSLRMGPWRSAWEVVILGRADAAFEVLRQNAAMGWMMLTMVEGLVRSQGGVGTMMLNESKHFMLDAVFAIQLTVLGVGVLQDMSIGWLKGVFCPYSRLTMERS